MDTDMNASLKAILEKLDQLTDRVKGLEETQAAYHELESPRTRHQHRDLTPEPELEPPLPRPGPRRPYHQDPIHEPNPVRPHRNHMDQDEQVLRSIRLEAPTFDGSLDPKIYVDWEGDMDQYFEWYEMTEERKCKFAKLRLTKQARLYWGNVKRLNQRRGDNPITTWRDMKTRLREKYLPESYHQRLLDQWQRLTQDSKTVSEYISKFDEFIMRCKVDESEAVTLSRFRAGLRDEIQRELFLREVRDLDQAYQIARDIERFQRTPIVRRPEPPRPSAPVQRPGPSRPSPSTPFRSAEKGKAPEVPRAITPSTIYFRCQQTGPHTT